MPGRLGIFGSLLTAGHAPATRDLAAAFLRESRLTIERSGSYGLLAIGNGHAPGTATGLGTAGVITVVTGAIADFVTGVFAGRLWDAGFDADLAVFFFAAFLPAGFLAGFFFAGFVVSPGFFFAGFVVMPGFFFAEEFRLGDFLAAFATGLFFAGAAFFLADFCLLAVLLAFLPVVLPDFFAAFAMRYSVG